MIEGANTASGRAEDTESIGQDESSQAVEANGVGTRTGLNTSSAVCATGGVVVDLAADSINAEGISRRARGTEVGGAAGDARESTVGASIVGSVEDGSSEASSAVVGLADSTIHAVGIARSTDTEHGVAGARCGEVKSRDADRA